jgi:hypothetical protein
MGFTIESTFPQCEVSNDLICMSRFVRIFNMNLSLFRCHTSLPQSTCIYSIQCLKTSKEHRFFLRSIVGNFESCMSNFVACSAYCVSTLSLWHECHVGNLLKSWYGIAFLSLKSDCETSSWNCLVSGDHGCVVLVSDNLSEHNWLSWECLCELCLNISTTNLNMTSTVKGSIWQSMVTCLGDKPWDTLGCVPRVQVWPFLNMDLEWVRLNVFDSHCWRMSAIKRKYAHNNHRIHKVMWKLYSLKVVIQCDLTHFDKTSAKVRNYW